MNIPPDMIDALHRARSIVVLTGAGASAESGVPTFRDALTGLWAKHDPMDLATPDAFTRDAELVTRWYDQRRVDALAVQPNAGHEALVRMQQMTEDRGARFTLVTQNVDRLHQRAGSTGVIELHGTLLRWRCVECGEQRDELGPAMQAYPPSCVSCGGARRPGVVWFGEALPEGVMEKAASEAGRCEVFLTIGTSSVVYPAAGLVDVAIGRGAMTVEINAEATPATGRVTHAIAGRSGQILPRIIEQLAEQMGEA